MKKLLALGLSLAMMASLTAVAFAAPTNNHIQQNDSGVNGEDADGQTVYVYTEATEDDDAESYMVTIPADIQVAWGDDTEQTGVVTVDHKLFDTNQVVVHADAIDALTKEGAANTLDVTMNDFDHTYLGTGANETDSTVSFTFSVSGFDAAPFGKYSARITFTATYGSQP